MERPFELFDHATQQSYGTYRDQDRVLQALYDCRRTKGQHAINTINILYVDENETEHWLGHGKEQWLRDWFEALEDIQYRLRMICSTDIVGLAEFIGFEGYNVSWLECEHPHEMLCPTRYHAIINDLYTDSGYTRLEALASAFIFTKEQEHGRLT